jgi:alpha-amylase
MQQQAVNAIYELQDAVIRSNDWQIIEDWRRLQTSDHFYYMCTKWFNDGDVHAYFSPYSNPYDAFTNYMNAWRDLKYRLIEKGIEL